MEKPSQKPKPKAEQNIDSMDDNRGLAIEKENVELLGEKSVKPKLTTQEKLHDLKQQAQANAASQKNANLSPVSPTSPSPPPPSASL